MNDRRSRDEFEREGKEANAEFAKAVLSDFGQILAASLATGTSVHRVRMRKLEEICNAPREDRPAAGFGPRD
jgi:hypothetical protein